MKIFVMSVALAGVATAAPLFAQGNGRNVDGIPPGQRPPAGMCRVWIDGVPPGRQSPPTNCATAQARAAANGGRVIYGSNSRNRQDCTYNQTTNGVSDVIFGRTGTNNTTRSGTNNTNCRDNTSNRVNGAWYPVGRDNNGGTIYERRTRDSNGNWMIQRARRDAFGNMSIISTRNARNDGTWNNRRRHGDDDEQGDDEDGRGKWKKHDKHDRGDGDDDRRFSRGDDRFFRNSNAVARGNGRGRDHKDRD